MLENTRRIGGVIVVAGLAAACASTPSPNIGTLPPNGGVYKVGNPYQIQGTWYYPKEQPDYDETGIASWYGPDFYGHHTANGEMYDGKALTAAHRTLPMPTNVRVTNLENGRSIIVRVNDRGPYAKGRIIDLSEAAARELDVIRSGTARVRVTYVGRADLAGGAPPPPETPPEIVAAVPAAPTTKVDTSALNVLPGATVAPPVQVAEVPPAIAAGVTSAPASIPTPPQDTPVTGEIQKVPVPAVTHLYVQVGAFSSQANAMRLQARFSGAGNLEVSPITRNGKPLYRVRSGPYDSVAQADAALARMSSLGSNDAQIVVDQ